MSQELNWGKTVEGNGDKLFVNVVKIVEAGEGNYGGLNCKYEKEIEKKDGSKATITGFLTIATKLYANGAIPVSTKDFFEATAINQNIIDSMLSGTPDYNEMSRLVTGKELKVLEYPTNKHNDAGYVRYKAWGGFKKFSNTTNVFSLNTDNKDIISAFKENLPNNYDKDAENIKPTEEVSSIATADIPF